MLLCAALVLAPDHTAERKALEAVIPPDSDEQSHRDALERAGETLRQILGSHAGRLQIVEGALSLNLDGAYVDVLEFDRAASASDYSMLKRAVEIYRGPLLEICPDEWAIHHREARKSACIHALETLAAHDTAEGRNSNATAWLRRVVAADPMRESACCALMRSLIAEKEFAAAIVVYRDLRTLLRSELNIDPAPDTDEAFRQVQAAMRGETHREVSGSPAISGETAIPRQTVRLEPIGGAVPLHSRYYVTRPEDHLFFDALNSEAGIVLVKGARQMGKTSLIARGLTQMRAEGSLIALTDFSALAPEQISSQDALTLALAQDLGGQLGSTLLPETSGQPRYAGNMGLERYLRREMTDRPDISLIWAFDSVETILEQPYASSLFGLFRSWYNRRAFDPNGPWSRITLVFAYSVEAYMLIEDPNQSPFNVGTQVTLEDFNFEQVDELNTRHGTPLRSRAEVARFHTLLGGHPFLTRLGLAALVGRGFSLMEMEAIADHEDSPFAPHLRQIVTDLDHHEPMRTVVREVLKGGHCGSELQFHRLRSAGILSGDTGRPRLRCVLYRKYLEKNLA
jgi:DNA-binding SARP family transcriptional activator